MIDSQFLNDVALYVEGRVAKVLLNETFEIADFTQKSVTGGTLAINYLVSASDLSHVDQIDILDADGNVISTNEVDIPIGTDTILLQTIEVKEEGS